MKKVEEMGLFVACYEIGGDKPGAPWLKVQLSVYALDKTVTGHGHLTQATNPPLDIATMLVGSYTYMTVMPRNVHILVTLHSLPPSPPIIGPLNAVELRMVLEEDWKSGTANYKYIHTQPPWHEIEGAPVRSAPCNTV